MKKVVITGATGLIGEKLTAKLNELGYHISIFTRDINKSKKIFPYVNAHFDWVDGNLWQATVNESDVIINLAGAPIAGKRWNEEYKNEIYNSRIAGTKKIVNAINSSNKQRVFLSASAIGYYGDQGDSILDENSLPGNDFLAKVCIDWEAEALKAENCRIVMPRIGVVLSEKGGALKEMLTPFKMNIGGPLGNGKQWWAWIHIDDLVNMFIWAVENENIEGPLNCVAPKPVTNKYFSEVLGKILHKPSFMKVPKFALKIALGESADFVMSSLRVVPLKARDNNFEFMYSEPEEAIKNLLG